MNNQQRLFCFDFLKLFAIFLVIWGHCIQYLVSSNAFDNPVFICIYSFHMPLFMMISGFFARKSLENKTLPDITKNKSIQLILPCASFGIILFLIVTIYSLIFDNISSSTLYAAFDSFIVKDLWFLKSLFLCYLLTAIAYSNKKYLPLKLCGAILISFFLNFYMLKRIYMFFIFGILLNYKFEYLKKHLKVIFTGALLAFILLQTNYDKNIYLTQISDVKEAFVDGNINEIMKTVGYYIYNIATGLAGCTTFISLFYLLRESFTNKIFIRFSKIGQFTLGIYIMQYIILERGLPLLINLDNIAPIYFNGIIAPLLAVVLLSICYLLTRLIDRNKRTAFFLLGKH